MPKRRKTLRDLVETAPIEHSTHLEYSSVFCYEGCEGCRWEFDRDLELEALDAQ